MTQQRDPAGSDHSQDALLAERYGRRSFSRKTVVLLAVLTPIAAAIVVMVAWAGFDQASPDVQSSQVTFEVVDEHTARTSVEVQLKDGVEAECRVRALAADKTAVGDLAFTPVDGRNDVEIRTERRATSVELLGCTTEDQNRPR
ncbi:DUF4307 domain-containing protein [Nocardioides pacificus]